VAARFSGAGQDTDLEVQLKRPRQEDEDEADVEVDAALPLYARQFGLTRAPFSIAPDPRYLYMSERHREALAHLLFGLQGGGGFVLLTGEIGSGKTTVCRCMLEQVPEHCNVAYIFNPRLTVGELLETVCDEFHIPRGEAGSSLKAQVDALNEWLLRNHAQGRISVLVIDEAQNLSPEVLEQLRLLTNLETNERKLLQIVLVGQPELRTMVAGPGLEQLAQRVIARYHLEALSGEDSQRYIRHRLTVSGLRGPLPFDRGALKRVMHHARGVARRINLLCDRALLGAYAEGKATVSARIVDKAASEAFGVSPERSGRTRWIAGSGVAIVAAALGGLALWTAPHEPLPAKTAAAQSAPLATSASTPSLATSAPAAANSAPAETRKPAAAWLSASDLRTAFGQGDASEAAVLRRLAQMWNLSLADADPCRAAAREGVQCFRDRASNLAKIRQLGRPGLLTLFDDHGHPLSVLLVGLDDRAATLRAPDGSDHRVTLASLAPLWRGSFATLWRVPQGYRAGAGDIEPGPGADALAAQLTELARKAPAAEGQPAETDLATAIAAFQLAHGLKPDGKAGPMTLMQLNPLIGVEEPRLEYAH
jgi:general secretion pathway protein A